MPDNRFLCDQMLERLGRYLRAAGYDTAIVEPGTSDDVTVRQTEEQDRILLTCDRELAGRAGGRAVLLLSNGLPRPLASPVRRGIKWQWAWKSVA